MSPVVSICGTAAFVVVPAWFGCARLPRWSQRCWRPVRSAPTHASAVGDDVLPDAKLFAACPSNSIDYAVMESSRPPQPSTSAAWLFRWMPAGAISAPGTAGHCPKDDRGNAAIGEAIFEQSNNTYVRTTAPTRRSWPASASTTP